MDDATTPGRDEIIAAIEAEWPAIEQLLDDLVLAPTTLGNEQPGQDLMFRAFNQLGLTTVAVRQDSDGLEGHPGAAPFGWNLADKQNLIGTWEAAGDGGRSLIIGGHIDVVAAEPHDMWTSAPYVPRRDGDWLYGRGAGDMKAGLAAMVGAVKGLQRLGLRPLAPVQLHSVVEEECTGNGALQCVLHGERAQAAIITEPTSLQLQTSQVGVLWFEVIVRGIPAHAGDAPIGANSIEAAYKVIEGLRALEVKLNEQPEGPFGVYPHPINLNVGVIRGGDWPSTVAAETIVSCRLAFFPGHDPSELQLGVETAVAEVDLGHVGFSASVRYEGFRSEGYTLDSDAELVKQLLQAQTAVTGTVAVTYASTATTDARAYQLYADTPSLCFGPHAENIHGIDERVYLPSVLQTAQTLALFITEWCGVTSATQAP